MPVWTATSGGGMGWVPLLPLLGILRLLQTSLLILPLLAIRFFDRKLREDQYGDDRNDRHNIQPGKSKPAAAGWRWYGHHIAIVDQAIWFKQRRPLAGSGTFCPAVKLKITDRPR
jgi:hypothetical protein